MNTVKNTVRGWLVHWKRPFSFFKHLICFFNASIQNNFPKFSAIISEMIMITLYFIIYHNLFVNFSYLQLEIQSIQVKLV